ncbi:MAG: class I tRNA ligase family protein, partial [Nanoarchaeota archaeon]
LEKDNFLVHKINYSHDYPLCWRCKSPLLMVSNPQWFLKISNIQSKLLSENERTNWIPSYMKLRMKAWLEGISDWPVSRKRYWGTPLPIWTCECGEKKVIGSKKELEKLSGKKVKSVHKPEIDEITIKCNCGKQMKRVEEVLDVWFDSGVSSWAALNEKEFKKFWPADLNIEGKDQIRGWWNSQIILSQIKFDKKPFENISVHGMVLDLGKRKMSKSKGNIISPQEIIEKYSRDYIRYYFAKTSKGDDFAFDENEFKEIEKVFRVLINVNTFVNQLEVIGSSDDEKSKIAAEDKWILSKYNNLIKNATEKYNEFKFTEVVQLIEQFLVMDLSRTYIKMIRDRQEETYEVLNEIRIGLLKLIAPISPFITEKIWQELKEKKIVKEESVHLSEFPRQDNRLINEELENQFLLVLDIIEKGLFERDKVQIGLKWPLSKAKIECKTKINNELQEIIKNQLNIKGTEIKINLKSENSIVELDTKITPELEAEGYAREISRKVQAGRKKAGLVKTDMINLNLVINKEFAD